MAKTSEAGGSDPKNIRNKKIGKFCYQATLGMLGFKSCCYLLMGLCEGYSRKYFIFSFKTPQQWKTSKPESLQRFWEMTLNTLMEKELRTPKVKYNAFEMRGVEYLRKL